MAIEDARRFAMWVFFRSTSIVVQIRAKVSRFSVANVPNIQCVAKRGGGGSVRMTCLVCRWVSSRKNLNLKGCPKAFLKNFEVPKGESQIRLNLAAASYIGYWRCVSWVHRSIGQKKGALVLIQFV